MASHSTGNRSSDFRHRIKEITLRPNTSKRPVSLEIQVNDKAVHKLPNIEPGQLLHWDTKTYPCDTHVGAKIKLKFTEKHRVSSDQDVFVEYIVSDDPNQSLITQPVGTFLSFRSTMGFPSKKSATSGSGNSLEVTVTFPNMDLIANDYSSVLNKASGMTKDKGGPLDKMGNARVVLKTLLGFGKVVAELHPTAKLVVGLCATAWEYLEKAQGDYDSLKRLIDGLEQMVPFVESVQGHATEDGLKQAILALLHLIEDVSNFVINYLSGTNATRTLQGFFDGKYPDRIDELLREFEKLEKKFHLAINVQALKQGDAAAQRALIEKLKPTSISLDTNLSLCQEGTRTKVLEDIRAWYGDRGSSKNLLWLYGQAGMGKSSIASSVCKMVHDAGALGGHFFFKRDDPHMRSPENMLNTIVHCLALQYELYGRAVASSIEEYSGLLVMPLGQRYTQLIDRPLRSLVSSSDSPSMPFVIVIDALDECERTNSRDQLIKHLRDMSSIVPWLKIFITSRPDDDIKATFGNTAYSHVTSRDLVSYDAYNDMLEYTRIRMGEIARRKMLSDWNESSIQNLAERAGGLFIWVETACKFIERGADPEGRLKQILDGTQSVEGSGPLDMLYTIAIQQAMGDQGADNLRIYRECIGAVVATGSRQPLSVSSLASLLSSYDIKVLRAVVNGLGAVLYEDATRSGAVRVYHPSFADFMLSSDRSGPFFTDPQKQNATLADCCLRAMMDGLRFNICALESSHVLNRNVPNLEVRVQEEIPPYLAYSCVHWSSHLTETSEVAPQGRLTSFLFGPQLFYWVEAMSLLRQLSIALSSLLKLIDWLSATDTNHSGYANDAYRFILTFYDAISESTPHLYVSAVALAPSGSKLAQRVRVLFPNSFTVTSGANESFTPWLQTMSHNDEVRAIACSTDGRRIVSGCNDGTVRIWDTETGAAVSEPLKSLNVARVAISFDGRCVASGSYDGTLRVWDAETSTAAFNPLESELDELISLTFSPDGRLIISGYGDGTVRFFNMETKAESSRLRLNHSPKVLSTALSPDGQLIVSCSRDGTIRIWSTETGGPVTEPITGHSSYIRCVAFSPDGRLLASGSDDTTVRLWDVSTGTSVGQPMTGHSNWVVSVAFSPDGRYLVSGSGDLTVRVWDLETCMPVCEPLVGHRAWVSSVAFCSSGRRVVSASNDHTVRIWDVVSGATTRKAPLGHSDAVSSVAFSADGRYIVSGSYDGTVRIWDAQAREEAHKPMSTESGTVRCVTFTSDSKHIVCLTSEKKVQVWEVEAGTMVREFSLGHSGRVISIALSPDGRRIASGSYDDTVGLWDAETGASVLPPLAGHSNTVHCVTVSPDSRLIASGSWDSTVRIWDAETGIAVGEALTGHSDWVRTVCFSPDSRRIASGSSDCTVRVWDVETSTALLEPLRGHSNYVFSVVFSPDSRHMISGSGDNTVRIWDADTGAVIGEPLVGHTAGVNSVAVSPDGLHISTGSDDKTVRIWNAQTNAAEPQLSIDDLLAARSPLSLSSSFLARHANESGWVTSSSGALLFWLPKEHHHVDDSIIRISAASLPERLVLDFSRFVQGASWASVAKA